ncbi:phage tail assembly chaperone [Pseudomonas huaxiensis]|uniref:phage tail assembly chaperone n=1 Tax=Pseudomonas huaxiensis TaxID=2213017 RepID=UPI000DA66A74|nr:phage tail assembly chaperone [Pseudomonas huaxiensis]
MLYSPDTGGFYLPKVHKVIPADVVEISAEQHAELMGEHAAGKRIVPGEGGFPVAVDPAELTEDQIATRERGWRDAGLADVAWLRDRHRDQLEIGADTTLTTEQYVELLSYMQQLRDWPQSADFPETPYRPSQPEWLGSPL